MNLQLKIRLKRWIKNNFPDGDTQAIATALREILLLTDQGRAYRRQILACYSQTRQAEIQPEFEIACESLLLEYQGVRQLNFLNGGGAA